MKLPFDPAGFWMSEKLDGWFAKWDGKSLWTASGNPMNAPEWFTPGLPDRVLHGELYAGAGEFHSIQGIVKGNKGWENLRFAIFDAPGTPFPPALESFTETPFAFMVPQIPCAAMEHLEIFSARIMEAKGEGVMLRKGNFFHKVKPQSDEEATVIGYKPSKEDSGIGSLLVQNARGQFSVSGLFYKMRHNPPKIGTLVTFYFFGLTKNGIPKSASFKSVRPLETLKRAA